MNSKARLLHQLVRKNGRVKQHGRGRIRISVWQFQITESKGALVAQVNPKSAADRAGMKVGDVVIRFDGKDVRDTRQLRNVVAATAPGTKVEIDVLRDGA